MLKLQSDFLSGFASLVLKCYLYYFLENSKYCSQTISSDITVEVFGLFLVCSESNNIH